MIYVVKNLDDLDRSISEVEDDDHIRIRFEGDKINNYIEFRIKSDHFEFVIYQETAKS